jgi:methionine synthase / methylenetetrahydrofolate reductase(NADPH)
VRGSRVLAAAGADLFDVPDNAAATVGRDSMVTAAAIQRETGKPALSHKTVTQSNALHLHSELLGCWDLGLQGLLAITGDVPRIGHMAALATRVGDLRSSVELLRLVARLRAGELMTGDRVADAPDFCAGCGMGSGRNLLPQVRWLGKKVEAGAEFVFTQPVFTVDQFERLRDATASVPIRVLPGLLPLTGARNAHMLAAGRIPGIEVPEELASTFDALTDATAQREHGLRLAMELARALRDRGSSGLYVIMPFGKTDYEDTARLLRAVREA